MSKGKVFKVAGTGACIYIYIYVYIYTLIIRVLTVVIKVILGEMDIFRRVRKIAKSDY